MSRVLLLLLLAGMLPAQDDKKKTAEGPPEFDVLFNDGGNVKLKVLEKELTVATKYGKLTIPVGDVRKITFGIRGEAPADPATLKALVEKLGADAFRDREAAQKELTDLKGAALAAAKAAMNHADAEVARRAGEVVKAIEAKLPAGFADRKAFDTIVTAEFTVTGKVEQAGLKVISSQFGESTVKVDQLNTVRNTTPGAMPMATINLDAAKYAKVGWAAWMDTGLDLPANTPLSVVCTGTIDQYPQTPGQYMAPPQGTQAQVLMPNTTVRKTGSARIMSGCVLGKIGDRGEPFVIGAGYKGTPAAEGRLYLIIAPSNWNNDSSGEFKVVINGGE